ncbi:MAG: hypothetical protein AAF556_05395 [Pseudomonadota bacterium]
MIQTIAKFFSVILCASITLAATYIATAQFNSAVAQPRNNDAVQLELEGGQSGLSRADRLNPNTVVRAYYTFISAGQFNEALGLLGPSFGLDAVREISNEIRALSTRIRDGKLSISLDQVYQQGDWALAVLLIEVANDDGSRSKLVADQYLLRVRDEWAVVPKQLRDQQSFRTFFNRNARVLNQWWLDNKAQIVAKLTAG